MARGCGRSHRRTEVSASASGRRRAFGTVVLVWMLSACTAGPDPGPFEITPVVDADQGELVTLLTSGDVDEDVVEFGLSGAAPCRTERCWCPTTSTRSRRGMTRRRGRGWRSSGMAGP